MARPPSSFREFEHTADLGVEIDAASLSDLFAASGEALFALIADPEKIEIRRELPVSASADGIQELLHAWLCELLARFNLDGFVARTCTIDNLTHGRVEGRIGGEELDLQRHGFRTEIKGVTYHDFAVWQDDGKWRARVIFDV